MSEEPQDVIQGLIDKHRARMDDEPESPALALEEVDPFAVALREASEVAAERLSDSRQRTQAKVARRYGLNGAAAAQLDGMTEREMDTHALRLASDRRNLSRYHPDASTAQAFGSYVEGKLASEEMTWL